MAGFNFFDILIIILIVRAVIVGRKIGLVPGLFFLSGVVTANFFALHYYTKFGKGIWEWLDISPQYGEFIAFIFIAGVIIAVFTLVRNGWQALIKVDEKSTYNVWSGLITTTLSYILLSAMLLFMVFILKNNFLVLKARNCMSYRILGKTSVRVYEGLFNFIVEPLFAKEKINEKVFKAYSRETLENPDKDIPSDGSKDKR
jgi:hypothetical protein